MPESENWNCGSKECPGCAGQSAGRNGPYSIGSRHWPGLSKLIEEAGEVQQVAGKILGTGGRVDHWDGSDLRLRLQEEIGDLVAACLFVAEKNNLDVQAIADRVGVKYARFLSWHSTRES